MVEVPTVTAADLETWYRLQQELGKLKTQEALLRRRIFDAYFPTPAEGVNKVELNDGTGAELKGTHKIQRDVDQGAYDAYRTDQKKEGSNLVQLPMIDDLVKWKPEVVLSEYRKLTDEERMAFDQCLIIKPGSPSLEISIPKRAKASKS